MTGFEPRSSGVRQLCQNRCPQHTISFLFCWKVKKFVSVTLQNVTIVIFVAAPVAVSRNGTVVIRCLGRRAGGSSCRSQTRQRRSGAFAGKG